MIPCIPNTVLPFDAAIVETLRTKYRLEFDSDYQRHVAQFHGGTPQAPYFTAGASVHRIGWMVALLNYECTLPGPLQPAIYYPEYDTRIEDRSLPSLIDHEIDPFFWGERIIPFAALYTNGREPRSLRLYSYDWNPDDCLCFDRSTSPHSVVYCDANKQVEEHVRLQKIDDGWLDDVDDPDPEVRYDHFITFVAESFTNFCRMLRESP